MPGAQVAHRQANTVQLYELKGNAGKAMEILGWEPSVSFEDIITLMVDEDLRISEIIGR